MAISKKQLDEQVLAPLEEEINKVKESISSSSGSSSDSMSGGDIPILPLSDTAVQFYTRRNIIDGLVYTDNLPGGYALTGSYEFYANKIFNKIKMIVGTPGWVRIGIVRGTGTNEYDGIARGIFKANPRYDETDIYPISLTDGKNDTTADGQSHTALKKWLIVRWEETPGLKEYGIPDEIITSPFEYLYVECRSGVAGFVSNKTGSYQTFNDLTVPSNTANTGETFPTAFISETNFNNNSYAVSNRMIDSSAQFIYENNLNKSIKYARWVDITSNQNDLSVNRGSANMYLNIGIYKRGSSSNSYLCPVIGNVITKSSIPVNNNINNAIQGYGPRYEDQQKLAKEKKKIYGIEFVATTPGDLTFYVFSSNSPETCKVLKQWTIRIRAIGRQLVHLPEEVVLKEGQWCGVSGATEAIWMNRPTLANCSESNKFKKGYIDTAQFAYGNPSVTSWTCKGDDETGVQNLIPYSSSIGGYSTIGFTFWSGVKYTGNNDPYDFTEAVLNTNNTDYLNICFACREGTRSKLEDANISIEGDSITTYAGIVPKANDFGGNLNTAGDNAIFYPNSGNGFTIGIDNTWWGALIKDCRARLIRNDAWSGSKITGTDSNSSSTACSSQIRTKMLHGNKFSYEANTTEGLGVPFGNPDYVFCMIGTNDLSGNIEKGSYSNVKNDDVATILGAFQTMVGRHRTNYPATIFIYFIIPRGTTAPYPYTNTNGFSISDMAEEMEKIAKAMGAYFVPLSYFSALNRIDAGGGTVFTPGTGVNIHPRGISTSLGTSDRLHPNAVGHLIIAHGLEKFIESTF